MGQWYSRIVLSAIFAHLRDNMRMQAIELATPRIRDETLFSDMTIGEAIKVIEKKKFQMKC